MPRVMDKLFRGINPYDGFNAAAYPTDFQGWNSDHPFLPHAIKLVRPQIIIEVGVWKGRSVIQMADVCKSEGLGCEIIAVDTWLGSSEHILGQQELYASMKVRHGRPDLYYTFLSNVLARGHQDVVTPLPMDSAGACVVLQRHKVAAGIIHIDGAHQYEAALQDIKSYWKLLAEDGLMIFDDYPHPSVTKAVNEFAAGVGNPIYACGYKAVMSKGKRLRPKMQVTALKWWT